jgi:hypothetical protein
MKNQIITPSEFLDVHVGQILGHTIQGSWSFVPKNVPFWAIVIFTRDLNVLIFLLAEFISPEMSLLMNQSFPSPN